MGNMRGCGDVFTECGKRPQDGWRTLPRSWAVKGFSEAKERPLCFSTQDGRKACGARRPFHLQRDEERVREDKGEDGGLVRLTG